MRADHAAMQNGGEAWTPLYLQIQATLRERIVAGHYAVESRLPTEAELCCEFNASRYTIREALRGLSEQGFVQRRQRVGTRVISPEPQVTYTQSFRSLADLFQNAKTTHYVLLASEAVRLDAALAARVGGADGQQWLRVTGVRWDKPGGSPICYVQSYVPARYRAIVADFGSTKGPFYALLEERSGEAIEDVVQEINALAMPDEIVKVLGLSSGSLALLLLRRYTTKSGTLIASYNWHRADRFTYTMQLHRRSGEEPSPRVRRTAAVSGE